MPVEDLFTRYLEIGASIFGMSRERAESIVRDLVASGEVAKGQATKAADWLVERGRAGTEELAEVVRREVRQQVSALGLATKEDVARLEALIAAATPASAARARPTGPVKKAPARKGAAAPPAAGERAAGITKSASVRRRTSGTGRPEAAPAPPAGGAVPPRG